MYRFAMEKLRRLSSGYCAAVNLPLYAIETFPASVTAGDR